MHAEHNGNRNSENGFECFVWAWGVSNSTKQDVKSLKKYITIVIIFNFKQKNKTEFIAFLRLSTGVQGYDSFKRLKWIENNVQVILLLVPPTKRNSNGRTAVLLSEILAKFSKATRLRGKENGCRKNEDTLIIKKFQITINQCQFKSSIVQF